MPEPLPPTITESLSTSSYTPLAYFKILRLEEPLIPSTKLSSWEKARPRKNLCLQRESKNPKR